jgi:hypothetical protein
MFRRLLKSSLFLWLILAFTACQPAPAASSVAVPLSTSTITATPAWVVAPITKAKWEGVNFTFDHLESRAVIEVKDPDSGKVVWSKDKQEEMQQIYFWADQKDLSFLMPEWKYKEYIYSAHGKENLVLESTALIHSGQFISEESDHLGLSRGVMVLYFPSHYLAGGELTQVSVASDPEKKNEKVILWRKGK